MTQQLRRAFAAWSWRSVISSNPRPHVRWLTIISCNSSSKRPHALSWPPWASVCMCEYTSRHTKKIRIDRWFFLVTNCFERLMAPLPYLLITCHFIACSALWPFTKPFLMQSWVKSFHYLNSSQYPSGFPSHFHLLVGWFVYWLVGWSWRLDPRLYII